MKAEFMWTPDVARLVGDATATHKALPRAKRKALRITSPKRDTKANNKANSRTNHSADQVITDWLAIHDPMNDRDYYCLNTTDCEVGADEFGDIDDEYAGLTILSPGKDTRRWRKGYNIL